MLASVCSQEYSSFKKEKQGGSKKKIVVWTARNFGADEVLSAAEILCVFQSGQAHSCVKRPGIPPARFFESQPKIKRERGEKDSSPRYTPVSRLSDGSLLIQLRRFLSGGQNLAALCTTASQNLAAVCGSHSLTETVDLGTMTLAGLIGTLHVVYTSY